MMNPSAVNDDLPLTVKNYLNKNALTGWRLELRGDRKFNNIIVVPAIEEYDNIPHLLGSLAANDPKFFSETLVVIVVNNRIHDSSGVKTGNEKSISLLRSLIARDSADQLSGLINRKGLNLGLIDASSPGLELPEKDGGVGLAREIGMDSSLKYFDYSNNRKKLLICLDADCIVEPGYLSAIVGNFNENGFKAAYAVCEHRLEGTEKEILAIICYEIFLRYYVLGLKYAGSPFAFPAIGSTMVCDYESYIKIGGMNKKKAAEDFYFMEKLAKITTVREINSAYVYPSNRGSWRVPFGTGQRVNRFVAGTHREYLLYNPESFVILKKWLALFGAEDVRSAEEYLSGAVKIHPALHDFLLRNSFRDNWEKIIRNSKLDAQIRKQKILWFDGFRTLKLIHFLRDSGLEQLLMFDAVDALISLMNSPAGIERSGEIPPLDLQIEYLKYLRRLK